MANPRLLIRPLTFVLAFGTVANLMAQKRPIYVPPPYGDSIVKGTDPNYILSYGRAFVLRVYDQKTFNRFNVVGPSGVDNIQYAGNTRNTLGLGFSYRFLTLNFGLVGLGGSDKEKGKTRSLDLQANLYYRKWMFDVMIKSYKGMYLDDKNRVNDVNGYYVNPDLRSSIIGLSGWRILNPEKFSYRAVMTQNEWQKKSAGTVLLGWEAYFGNVNAHDSIVPVGIQDPFVQKGVKSLNYIKTGPGVGYAYNFVFQHNWFLSAGLTYNIDFSFMKESAASRSKSKFLFQPNLNYRVGAGYNSSDWNINLQFLNNNYPIKGAITDGKYKQNSGSYRLSFNRRLYLGKKIQKMIQPVDQRMNVVDSAVHRTLDRINR